MSAFAKDSLEPFTFKNIFYIPPAKGVLVRTLCMPQIKPVMASYNPVALNDLNNIYIDYVNSVKKITCNLGERIYVSRKKSRRRKIENENEVIEILNKYNFTVIYNEDYSFFEQVAIYSQVKYLISIHGAGLTNMLFMQSPAAIFELHKKQTNTSDQHSLIFWYMADALGLKYYHQICEPTDNDDDFFEADFIVDIELLKRNLKLMMQ
jgi:capsular polysaccharide biosynthesis protein